MQRATTAFLQTFIVLVGVIVLALLLREPQLEGVNAHRTNFEIYFQDPFLAIAYAGSIPFFVALYQAFKLLGYVSRNAAFSEATVKALRTIKYCAFTIIGFVAVEEVWIMLNHGEDDATGAFAMGVVITLGSIVVAAAATMFEGLVQRGAGANK